MRKMKKISLILVAVILLASLSGCGSPAPGGDEPETRTWKIGHIRPEGAVADKDIRGFADAVAEGTEGKINIEVYPASQLGDYQVVQERVGMGDIEMQLAPVGTNVDKSLGISGAPYLASNWDEAREVFKKGGILMNAVEEKFENQGIKVIASYPVYFGGIALSKEPKEPGNPNVPKDMKIRVPGIKVYELNAESLGFIATPIPWAETFTAIQTGIVDGAIGGGAEGYYASLREVTNYYLPVNDHFEMWYLYINLDLWNELTDEEKGIIEEIGLNFEQERYKLAEQDEKEYENKLKEAGITVYEFTDEELAAMAKKARETVWPEIREDFGAELFDSITKNMK